jgi:hypothetical protein
LAHGASSHRVGLAGRGTFVFDKALRERATQRPDHCTVHCRRILMLPIVECEWLVEIDPDGEQVGTKHADIPTVETREPTQTGACVIVGNQMSGAGVPP